jgi:hypothetical protein
MSFAARLLNVFAMPGEVFAGVKSSRVCVGNWLVPALLSALVGLVTAVVIVSQPSLVKQMRERIDQQAKGLEQQVHEGKIKQADADRTLALTRALTQPPVLKVLGGAVAAGAGVARVFWWALILWVLGRRFLKARFGYIKTLEVAGLALMISVLGAVVTLLLTLNLSNLFAAPSLALVVSDFDAHRKSPLLLGAVNLFSLWLVGVLSVGLGKLADVPFLRAAWVVFAAWIIQESFLVLLAGMLGQFAF